MAGGGGVVPLLLVLLAAMAPRPCRSAAFPDNVLEHYEKVAKSSLPTQEKALFKNMTLDGCSQACYKINLFRCRSFEYETRTRTCVISQRSRQDGLALTRADTVTYYEDKMQEPHSHPTAEQLVGSSEAEDSCKHKHHTSQHHVNHAPEDEEIVAPRDCIGYNPRNGSLPNGIYLIKPDADGAELGVACDMVTDGGGWTVFLRRSDGSTNFTRKWADYVIGFGPAKGEYWLGLEYIHMLTAKGIHELRIDVERTTGEKRHAIYRLFQVKSRDQHYMLDVNGYQGTTGDWLAQNDMRGFDAIDRDKDEDVNSCGKVSRGGWWFDKCQLGHPNGVFRPRNGTGSLQWGVHWEVPSKESVWLKSIEMKIRRIKRHF